MFIWWSIFKKQNKNKGFKIPMLRLDLCEYSDAYIVAKWRISNTGTNNSDRRNKKLTLKNNILFRSCIIKINNTFMDNAEDIDIVMPMCNLLEYSSNYSMTSRSLWNYYRDEMNDDTNENNDSGNYRINNNKTTTSECFEHKTELIGSTPPDNSTSDAKVIVSLKYFSNLWRSLNFPSRT